MREIFARSSFSRMQPAFHGHVARHRHQQLGFKFRRAMQLRLRTDRKRLGMGSRQDPGPIGEERHIFSLLDRLRELREIILTYSRIAVPPQVSFVGGAIYTQVTVPHRCCRLPESVPPPPRGTATLQSGPSAVTTPIPKRLTRSDARCLVQRRRNDGRPGLGSVGSLASTSSTERGEPLGCGAGGTS